MTAPHLTLIHPRADDWLPLFPLHGVLFPGGVLPLKVFEARYIDMVRDCMIVAGTSATVYPAAEFPFEILRRGGCVIEVNPGESELTPFATLSLRGPGGALLSRLAERVQEGRAA